MHENKGLRVFVLWGLEESICTSVRARNACRLHLFCIRLIRLCVLLQQAQLVKCSDMSVHLQMQSWMAMQYEQAASIEDC